MIFAIANDDYAHLDRVLAVDQREVIAGCNVGRWRKQGPGGTIKAGEVGDGRVRDAIIKTPAGEQLRISEIVGGALPKFADWRNALAVIRDVYLGFIDQSWTDQPGIGNLVARAGPQAIGRYRRQLRSDEGPIGIDQVVMVVKVTSVDAVLFVEAIIQPDIVFAIVQRVGLLKRRIIRGGRVRVSRRQFLHRAVN